MFSCEFCQISKNTLFTEHLWTTASTNREKDGRKNFWLFVLLFTRITPTGLVLQREFYFSWKNHTSSTNLKFYLTEFYLIYAEEIATTAFIVH